MIAWFFLMVAIFYVSQGDIKTAGLFAFLGLIFHGSKSSLLPPP